MVLTYWCTAATRDVRSHTSERVFVPVDAVRLVRSPLHATVHERPLTINDDQAPSCLRPFHGPEPRLKRMNRSSCIVARIRAPTEHRLVGTLLLIWTVDFD